MNNPEPQARLDHEQAAKDARIKPRPKGAAAHWYRCSWYLGTRRCLLSEEHTKAGKPHDWEPEDK